MAYNCPIVTAATASSDDELREAAKLFLDDEDLSFEKTEGGVNNKVYLVNTSRGGRFVMRIYNNGFNTPRVQYEHAVLLALRELLRTHAESTEFEIPTLLDVLPSARSRAGATATYAPIMSGAQVCMFRLIAGGPATLESAFSIGKSTALLVRALTAVDVAALPCPNPLYRNLYDAHHAMTRERFLEVMARPEFSDSAVREPTAALLREIDRAETLITQQLLPITRALGDAPAASTGGGLPVQQIHADLHTDNVLVVDHRVSAILDFEFTARDWRAMEAAVGLSKYVGLKPEKVDIPAVVTDWVKGYAAGGGRLTADEVRLMPDLIILRILSNVVYFAGRAYAGEDDIIALTARVGTYAARCAFLHARRDWLTALLSAHVPRDEDA